MAGHKSTQILPGPISYLAPGNWLGFQLKSVTQAMDRQVLFP